ncbi:P-II family nitrogen regulator [Desulfotomaculum defluvii]
MENVYNKKRYELLCVIVNYGLGSKVIKTAKENGISGCTVFLGKGTIKSHILELLGLNDTRKEIVFMITDSNSSHEAFKALNKKFKFEKHNHGIVFSTSVSNLLGVRNCIYEKNTESRGVEDTMYNAIFTVVDRGKAEQVIDAAVSAGSKGGTIINARGSGIHETNMLFSMVIEPEKEIVMILSEKNLTDAIVLSIRDALKIDEPGMGIMFILDINKAYGLV